MSSQPGYRSDHIPVEISADGNKAPRSEEDADAVGYEAIPIEEDVDKAVKVKRHPLTYIRVSAQDTEKYGCSPGCPACEYVVGGQQIAAGQADEAGATQVGPRPGILETKLVELHVGISLVALIKNTVTHRGRRMCSRITYSGRRTNGLRGPVRVIGPKLASSSPVP